MNDSRQPPGAPTRPRTERVMLINSPLREAHLDSTVARVAENLFYNSAPLGIGYLGAVLERAGYRVALLDAAVERIAPQEVLERVKSFGPDMVGFSCTTYSFPGAHNSARLLKERLDLPVIVGGPHVSGMAEPTMDTGVFDIAVLGEGEDTILDLTETLIDGRDLSAVEGIAYFLDGSLQRTAPRPLIADLDRIPVPARHLLPTHLYAPQPNDERDVPKHAMISSRGCPYSCIFCHKSVFGNRYRSFSPGYIVDEMAHLIRDHGARDLAFVDSTFSSTPERVEGILNEINRRGLKVSWTCSVRANVMTRDLLEKMRDAGCWRVRIGAESGNDQVLKDLRKGVTAEQVRQTATWADEAGLQPKAFFMVGHLSDTPETIEETVQFACSLPLTDITVQINTPLPGTAQYDKAQDHGELQEEDVDFSFFFPAFVPQGMSRDELFRLSRQFYRRFYLRPEVFARHLRTLRRPSDLKRYVRAVPLLAELFLGTAGRSWRQLLTRLGLLEGGMRLDGNAEES